MSLKVPAQGHAGVFDCLLFGEDLVIAQRGRHVVDVKDFQRADLQGGREQEGAGEGWGEKKEEKRETEERRGGREKRENWSE